MVSRLTAGDTGGEDGFSKLAVLATKAEALEALARLEMKSGRKLGGQDRRVQATVADWRGQGPLGYRDLCGS
jgi:hypothetical protein